MPSPADFRRAFGLEQGSRVGTKHEWLIESSRVGHVVKQQNELYEFPTDLTLAWQGGGGPAGKQAAQRAFQAAAKERPIVYSAYGSPYECSYGSPTVAALEEGEEDEEAAGGRIESSGPRFRITCLGKAVRRRDLPTLKQKAAEEREARGVTEVTPEDERRYLSSFRVMKSRFGTSRCTQCGETIEPGVKICKLEGEGGRGGWAHASCEVARQRGGAAQRQEADREGEEGAEAGQGSRGKKRKRTQPAGGKRHGGNQASGGTSSKGGKGVKEGSGQGSSKGGKPAGQPKASRGGRRKRQAAEE